MTLQSFFEKEKLCLLGSGSRGTLFQDKSQVLSRATICIVMVCGKPEDTVWKTKKNGDGSMVWWFVHICRKSEFGDFQSFWRKIQCDFIGKKSVIWVTRVGIRKPATLRIAPATNGSFESKHRGANNRVTVNLQWSSIQIPVTQLMARSFVQVDGCWS